MDVTIRSYIKRISRTNLVFPAIVLVIAAVLMFFIPLRQVLSPPKAASAQEVFDLYNAGTRYVEFDLKNLHYTTYDYYTGKNGKAACYYYLLEEDKGPSCLFFLLPAEQTNNRADALERFTGKAKLVTGGNRFLTFLNGFALDIDWNAEALADISSNFAVSVYDYQPAFAIVLAVLLLAIVLFSLAYLIANLVFMLLPHLHPSCKRLKRFGLDGEDFTEIDKELADNLLFRAGQIFITENYLIVLGKKSLWMVPLFNIVWAYKYSQWNPLVRKNKLSYALIVITSPKDKIRITGNRKAHTDRILQFLEENYTHITVGYSDEIREQMEALL